MNRAIGFNLGLRGDLIMSTVAARSFKEQYPGWHLTLGVGPQFKDLLPLFHDHPYFDAVHTYTSYENWPQPADLEYLTAAKFDMTFHGKPQHRDEWFKFRHQYAEAAYMVGLSVPADTTPKMKRWFSLDWQLEDTVAFAPFGGNGGVNDKMLSVEQAKAIVGFVESLGYEVLHLGAPDEPDIGGFRRDTCYFDSVRNMLSCHALIHCDTGMGHVAGAYNQRSLGIYGHRYYGSEFLKNIQPLHSNFLSVDHPTVADIELDKVFNAIKLLLT